MKFSFIVPFYNREMKVLRCLKSLMEIKANNIEFIVVDDGSTKETYNSINNLINQDSRFLLITQEHRGVSNARNTGIDRSIGEYILFVDSDDYVNSAEVELLLRNIKDNDEVVIFNFTKLKADGQILEEVSFADRTVETKEMLIELSKDGFNPYILNLVWNKVYKKSILVRGTVKFDERYYYGEDLIFNLYVLKKVSHVRFLNINSYNYIIDLNSSISTSYCEDISVNTKATLESITSLYQKYGLCEECWDKLIEYYSSSINRVFNHRKRYINETNLLEDKLEKDSIILKNYLDYVKGRWINLEQILFETRTDYR